MTVFPASSVSGGLAFVSRSLTTDAASQNVSATPSANFFCSTLSHNSLSRRPTLLTPSKVSVSDGSSSRTVDGVDRPSSVSDDARQVRRSADWKAARAYRENGLLYEGRVEGFNGGGLLVRFYSLIGFLPYPQLSPSHACKDPDKKIQEIARSLVDSVISVKVIQADEENRKLIFSEKESSWLKFSPQLNVGDTFVARVGSLEDYGVFVHLRFPDGLYHITGFVHVSEVSWDLVQDVRDVLAVGDHVRVKVINIDREKSRVAVSIKQLEEDPLLETLDKVIPKDYTADPNALDASHHLTIEPLPGLDTIIRELVKEDGIQDVRISRQGFEKRVVSQDLQLWLSNAPPVGDQYTLLARAGRQVQEIQLVTSLDSDGIKKALQHVLERVP